ncbi:hypothetical protein ATANTOWER_006849 [Ataeniobius toweri]|uniref:Uncharacterized protein n=1 Tax=Ataeniobius toweri TaxID=208326 RepID=A0ABU7A185_9TELE|nr:hypothetical protein [Ataeniobius toweri]
MHSTTARIKDTSERAVVGLRSLHTPVRCLPSGIGGQEKERAFWLRSGLGLEVGYWGSGIVGCWRGLWARHCSSLGLLHGGCRVVLLGLSSALLWVVCGSNSSGPAGVPVPWGAFGCLWLRCPPCLSLVQGAGLSLLTLTIAYLYGETLSTRALTLVPTGIWI